jgi:hypothetical protein
MVAARRCCGEEIRSYYVMSPEFLLFKMKRVLKMDDGDAFQTI